MAQTQRDDKIDIEAIMGRIRENVRRKKELGVYTDADVEDVASRGRADGDDAFGSHIALLKRNHEIGSGCEFTSHRRLSGPFIVFAKRFLLRLLIKAGAPLWERQTGFNQQSLMLLEAMSNELKELKRRREQDARAYASEIESLNARIGMLTAKVTEERNAAGAQIKKLDGTG